ncbi:hypothetical protein MC885_017880, partial [Smutsia gigantea]
AYGLKNAGPAWEPVAGDLSEPGRSDRGQGGAGPARGRLGVCSAEGTSHRSGLGAAGALQPGQRQPRRKFCVGLTSQRRGEVDSFSPTGLQLGLD